MEDCEMSKHLPPVPPASRSPKGPGGESKQQPGNAPKESRDRNYDEQGQQGNTRINTTHQGYQQDR
jgi:hypothetical protein